jgi:glutathione peroxidase
MTLRQRVLKFIYPLFVSYKRSKGNSKIIFNKEGQKPAISFYNLSIQLNNDSEFSFDQLKGKKVLLVNTASNCGYTNQYSELQKLYTEAKDHLEIIGFPANDFKEQEKGTDEEIAQFCQVNYGVTFPLAKKSSVIKSSGQSKVFQWLTSKDQNGWNEQPPIWNFSKYLVNESGTLTHYFDPSVSPLSEEVKEAINIVNGEW